MEGTGKKVKLENTSAYNAQDHGRVRMPRDLAHS